VGIAFRRKCLSSLPTFFSCLGFYALQSVVYLLILPLCFAFTRVAQLYGWILVSSTLAGLSLEIAVIYELWNKVVLSRSSVANIVRPLPRWSAAVLLLVITIVAALLPQNVSNHALQLYSTLSASLNLLNLGLLLILLLVSRLMGVSWGILPAGAALGIAIGDVGDAARSALLNQMGPYFFMDIILEGSSLLAAIVWLTCVLKATKALPSQNTQVEVPSKYLVVPEQLSKLLGG